MKFQFRSIAPTDESFLWQMLYYAAHVDEELDGSIEKARQNPFLIKYVAQWGQAGDLGFVAEEADTRRPLGSAWLRVFLGEEKNCADIEDGTPELAIAVIPSCLGQGIGAQLLHRVLDVAAANYPAVYLSVRSTNPAKRLYERFGFVVIGELTNRVGGTSFHMLKAFRWALAVLLAASVRKAWPLTHVALQPGEHVLDVACGTGIVARLAAPHVGKSGRVVGIDLNTGMFDMARAQVAKTLERVKR